MPTFVKITPTFLSDHDTNCKDNEHYTNTHASVIVEYSVPQCSVLNFFSIKDAYSISKTDV